MGMMLLGNFGRYGVQPFCFSYETGNNKDNNDKEDDAEEADGMLMRCCVAYHTLTGGHFDSKSRFLVEEMTKDNSGAMVMSMTLAIPNGRRALLVHLAKVMVLSSTHPIARSIWIQTDQQLPPTTTK